MMPIPKSAWYYAVVFVLLATWAVFIALETHLTWALLCIPGFALVWWFVLKVEWEKRKMIWRGDVRQYRLTARIPKATRWTVILDFMEEELQKRSSHVVRDTSTVVARSIERVNTTPVTAAVTVSCEERTDWNLFVFAIRFDFKRNAYDMTDGDGLRAIAQVISEYTEWAQTIAEGLNNEAAVNPKHSDDQPPKPEARAGAAFAMRRMVEVTEIMAQS